MYACICVLTQVARVHEARMTLMCMGLGFHALTLCVCASAMKHIPAIHMYCEADVLVYYSSAAFKK